MADLKIAEFNAALSSEEPTSPLIAELAKLTETESPEEVVAAAATPAGYWFGWT